MADNLKLDGVVIDADLRSLIRQVVKMHINQTYSGEALRVITTSQTQKKISGDRND